MSRYGICDSFLTIECESREKANEIIEKIENETRWNDLFQCNLYHTPGKYSYSISLWLNDAEMYRGFDDDIEEFAEWIKETFGKEIYGFLLQEIDGTKYRGEVDLNGKLHFVDFDFLNNLTNNQICELQGIAEDKFEKEPIKIKCPHCGQENPVLASLIKISLVEFTCFEEKGEPRINFNNPHEVEGEFEFICNDCRGLIASDVEELKNILKKGASK